MWAGPIEQMYILFLALGGAVLLLAVVSVLIYLINAVLSYALVVLDMLVHYPLLDWAAVGVLAVLVGCLYLGPAFWQLCQDWLTQHGTAGGATPAPPALPDSSLLCPSCPSHRPAHSVPILLTSDWCRNCGSEMALGGPCRMCGWRP